MNQSPRRTAVLLLCLGTFSWSACSGGLCDKADQASHNLSTAISSCPLLAAASDGGTSLVSVFSRASCQNALNSCSANDQQIVASAYDCISKLNPCVPGQEGQFALAYLLCLQGASSLSDTCRRAFSP